MRWVDGNVLENIRDFRNQGKDGFFRVVIWLQFRLEELEQRKELQKRGCVSEQECVVLLQIK